MRSHLSSFLLTTLAAFAMCGFSVVLRAQEARMAIPAGANIPPEVRAKMEAEMKKRGGSANPGKPPGKPGGEKKGGDKKKKEEDGKKKEEGAGEVTRPQPSESANPVELDVKPDKDGNVSIQLRGQKWIDVLQMVADWTDLNLDWTGLPNDAVNLTTTRKYTVEGARSAFNRMLLDRGYTMLIRPELNTMYVYKIDKLNPALVPTVLPGELDGLPDYQFAKVSFRLGDWLKAEETAKDIEQIKSANGKIKPLKATNRLEVIDAVVNLRYIRDMLKDENVAIGQKQLVKPFYLKFRGAEDVSEMLHGILGLDPPKKPGSGGGPMSSRQMQQQMQMAMRQAQQQAKKGAPAPQKPKTRLVVNKKLNMILVFAEPREMATVEQAIRLIDVVADEHNSLQAELLSWHSYKLATMDPEPLVQILKDVGNLDYNTVIEVDSKNKAIVAHASLADHVVIKSLIDKLDGSGRQFKVIPLRRLKADYVAGTIKLMMGVKEEDNQSSRRRYYWWRNEEEESTDKFNVDADIENNLLIVRANKLELEEINDLLVQLGEIRVPGSNTSRIRTIDAVPGETTMQMLERIRKMWPSIAPNDLEIDVPEPVEADEKEPTVPAQATDSSSDTTTTRWQPTPRVPTQHATFTSQTASPVRFVQLNSSRKRPEADQRSGIATLGEAAESGESDEELLRRFREIEQKNQASARKKSATPAPVRIGVDPSGKLVITSEDTDALDKLEDLLIQYAPAPKYYNIYKLRYADSFDVQLTLEDFFEEDDGKDNNSGFNRWYWGWDFDDGDKKSPNRLSNRKPIKFIRDIATNSIVVQNADAKQLATIEELIAFYDKPEPPDSQTVRKMAYIPLNYANSQVVVDKVKEVFIDLLTPNDKARQKKGGEQKSERTYNYNYGGSSDEMVKVPKFKGQLHLTADTASNTVVILAPVYILKIVQEMVERLDESAKPSTDVQVVKLDGTINSAQVRETLAKMLGEKVVQTDKKKGENEEGKKPDQPQNGNRVTAGG